MKRGNLMSTARATGPLQFRRGDARGQVLVLFALVLVVLLLVSALAIDYGGWLVAKRNYQNVGDAASLAGAQQLTRPLTSTSGPKNLLAREAAWASLASALGFTGVDPAVRAAAPSNLAYQEDGYTVWVASPPSDANVPCAGGNPLCINSGNVYVGHLSGPGVVFVRIDHEATTYMSRIAGIGRNVSAWATAGRFPANFAVIGLCDPFDVSAKCLANDANIKLDGSNTNLIIETGDLGSNRWVKSGGSNSGVALGPDSNAFMAMYDTCWGYSTNQCQIWSYDPVTGTIDMTLTRSAIPLGAPITDPGYLAPTINDDTTPNQCLGTGSVSLASTRVLEQGPVPGSDMQLAAVVRPKPPQVIVSAAVKVNGTVLYAGSGVSGLRIDLMQGGTSQKNTTTGGGGTWNINGVANGVYDVRVSDTSGNDVYNTFTLANQAFNSDTTVPDITVQKNALVTGTVTSSSGGAPISGATVTITSLGVNYTATTNGSGVYSRYIASYGNTVSYSLLASAPGYVNDTGSVSAPTALETTYTVNFSLTPAPASLTGTITDQTTGLPVPGVIVSLSSGESATTNASGVYDIPSTFQGTKTITLSGASMTGYYSSTPNTPGTFNVSGSATQDFTLWPKGCNNDNSDRGDYDCGFSTADCGTVTNPDNGSVSCSKFDQSNAIRPGTYHDITIDGCAWLDPRGGVTGLETGTANQSAGIYHITGTIDIRNDSYLFGDGVTLVFDQEDGGESIRIDVANGGGFVLNYGSLHNTINDPASGCNLGSVFSYDDIALGYEPCFRTVDDSNDYAYGAWTTKGQSAWSGSGTSVAYDDTVVDKGTEMGITFFMYGSGLGTHSRFAISTANMGYLFNGVLYAPGDDVELGGGKNGQTAAGQIVGWTIEYHGGTQIRQNWYGDPIDGPPFLIEPVLGE
jgi:Flp pilus assembly protein TadG